MDTYFDKTKILETNKAILLEKGLDIVDFMDLEVTYNQLLLRNPKEIYYRAFCLSLLGVKSENIKDTSCVEIVKLLNLSDFFYDYELRFLNSTYSPQNLINEMDLKYESSYALSWVIGLSNEIKYPKDIVDAEELTSLFLKDQTEILSRLLIIDVEKLVTVQDLYFRLLWNARHSRINNHNKDFEPVIVQERLAAIRWATNSNYVWGESALYAT
jgi:hypothetical protein